MRVRVGVRVRIRGEKRIRTPTRTLKSLQIRYVCLSRIRLARTRDMRYPCKPSCMSVWTINLPWRNVPESGAIRACWRDIWPLCWGRRTPCACSILTARDVPKRPTCQGRRANRGGYCLAPGFSSSGNGPAGHRLMPWRVEPIFFISPILLFLLCHVARRSFRSTT